MTIFTGTQNVDPGIYLNLRRLSLTTIEKRGALPGEPQDRYRRVPLVMMLAAAPLVGLVYVIFLPFIGFAAVATLLAGKTMEGLHVLAGQLGRVQRPAWAPALAFFSRSKPHQPAEGGDDVQDAAWIAEVEKKIEEQEKVAR